MSKKADAKVREVVEEFSVCGVIFIVKSPLPTNTHKKNRDTLTAILTSV